MNNTQLEGFAPAIKSESKLSKSPASNKLPPANIIGAGRQSVNKSKNTISSTLLEKQTKKKKRGPKKKEDVEEETTIIQPLSQVTCNFEPLSLPQIKLRISALLEKLPKDLPSIPPAWDESIDQTTSWKPVAKFANEVQVVIEEYNLLLSLVNASTYKWGVDRSGASQQNLSVMSAELQQCQETITNVVSSRISNVLCPAVDVLAEETEIIRDNGEERKVVKEKVDAEMKEPATKKRKLDGNHDDQLASSLPSREVRRSTYARLLVDPGYVHLCHQILARNGLLIRHTVATSIHTAHTTIGDYLKAMKKETGEESKASGWA